MKNLFQNHSKFGIFGVILTVIGALCGGVGSAVTAIDNKNMASRVFKQEVEKMIAEEASK